MARSLMDILDQLVDLTRMGRQRHQLVLLAHRLPTMCQRFLVMYLLIPMVIRLSSSMVQPLLLTTSRYRKLIWRLQTARQLMKRLAIPPRIPVQQLQPAPMTSPSRRPIRIWQLLELTRLRVRMVRITIPSQKHWLPTQPLTWSPMPLLQHRYLRWPTLRHLSMRIPWSWNLRISSMITMLPVTQQHLTSRWLTALKHQLRDGLQPTLIRLVLPAKMLVNIQLLWVIKDWRICKPLTLTRLLPKLMSPEQPSQLRRHHWPSQHQLWRSNMMASQLMPAKLLQPLMASRKTVLIRSTPWLM